jgi:molybdenum cofactor cytidylyltransferase
MPSVCHGTAAVILSAGNSVRMGTHKALLRFDERHNFIQKIVSGYAEVGVRKMVVVVNKDNKEAITSCLSAPEYGTVQLAVNEHPEWERFYSIKCGLVQVAEFENCFIHNCDNPFVDPDVIRKLFVGFQENALTIPEFEGQRGHPVLLPLNIIQAVLCHPENSCNFKTFLSPFQVKTISVDNNSILFNINTKEDLQNTV